MAALPHAPQSASIRSSSVMSQSLLHIGQSVIPDILRLSRGCPRRHREAQTVSTGRVSGPACFAARVRRTHEKLPTGSRRVAWRVPERERLASEHRKGGGPGDRSLGPPAEHRVRCPASDALMSGARASARPAPQRSDTRTDRLPALCMHRGVLACPPQPRAAQLRRQRETRSKSLAGKGRTLAAHDTAAPRRDRTLRPARGQLRCPAPPQHSLPRSPRSVPLLAGRRNRSTSCRRRRGHSTWRGCANDPVAAQRDKGTAADLLPA